MQVKSPYKAVTINDLTLGQVVVLHIDAKPVVAIAMAWAGGDKVCLQLSGDNPGNILYQIPFRFLALTEKVDLQLPLRPDAWVETVRPKKDLTVAVAGPHTYFVFPADGKHYALAIATGTVSSVPQNPFYVSEWEMRTTEGDELIIAG